MRLRIFWPGHLGQTRDSQGPQRTRLLIGWCRTEGSEAHVVVAGAVDHPGASEIEGLRATLAILNETSAARERDQDVDRLSPELRVLGILTPDGKGKQKDDGELDILDSCEDVALLVSLPASAHNSKTSRRLSFLQSVIVLLFFHAHLH